MPGSIKIDDGSGNYTILTNAGSLGSDKTLTIPNETGTLNTQSVSVSITPSSTSSKIFVIVSHYALITRDSGLAPAALIALVRDSTILRGDTARNLLGEGGQMDYPISLSYLDSPSSTSSLTYKTQGKVVNAANNERLFTAAASNLDSIVAM